MADETSKGKSRLQVALAFPNAKTALSVVGLGLAGLAVTLLVGLLFSKSFLIEKSLKTLTVSIISFIYIARPGARMQLRAPSPAAIGWCVAGFFFAMVASRSWAAMGLTIGVLAGLMVRLDPKWLLLEFKNNRKMASVALAGALSGPALLLLQKTLWLTLARATAYAMEILLTPFYTGLHVASKAQLLTHDQPYLGLARKLAAVGIKVNRKQQSYLLLGNENVLMKFVESMNVTNGLFLLPFLVAAIMLLHESVFKNLHPAKIYGATLLCVFVANTVWLCAMYMAMPALGAKPDGLSGTVSDMMSTGATPIIGWLGYLLLDAGVVALLWCYAQKQPSQLK